MAKVTIKPCPACGGTKVAFINAGLPDSPGWVECLTGRCNLQGPTERKGAKTPIKWNAIPRAYDDENAAEAGTMRMLREDAQKYGYEDALDAVEVAGVLADKAAVIRAGLWKMGCRPVEHTKCPTCALAWRLQQIEEAKNGKRAA
jgi:ssDNA-binding Zn-finger/Zn-ribbon topoisomerase 1